MKFTFTLLIIGLLTLSIISTSTVLGIIDSPRKQMVNGISAEDVVCKNELQLMLRSNGSAICIKPSSVERFVDRGIAQVIDTSARGSEKDIDISPEKILVYPTHAKYDLGSVLVFTGTAMPNQDLEVSLEDSNGDKVYVDILEIDSSGQVYLEVITDESFDIGTYFLILKQSDDSEIVPVIIGESTEDIAVAVEKFHYDLNSQATLEVFGPSSAKLSLTILNSKNQIQFEDTINLDATGNAEYLLDLSGYKKGVYSIVMNYGSEETHEEFTVGLSTRTAPIEITIVDNYYKLGETVILFGESTEYTKILIKLIDPDGEIIDKIEYYTDDDGKFTYALKISLGKQTGTWKIQVSNAAIISELTFEVIDETTSLTIKLDKEGPFKYGDFVTISGTGVNSSFHAVIQIKSSDDFFELTPGVTSEGAFSVSWVVPDFAAGNYVVSIDDGTSRATTNLIVVY